MNLPIDFSWCAILALHGTNWEVYITKLMEHMLMNWMRDLVALYILAGKYRN